MGQGSVKSVGCASNIPLIGRGNPVFEPARMQRSKCNFDCPLIRCTATFPSCFVPLRISVKRESFLTLLLCEIFPISNLNDSFEATKKKGKNVEGESRRSLLIFPSIDSFQRPFLLFWILYPIRLFKNYNKSNIVRHIEETRESNEKISNERIKKRERARNISNPFTDLIYRFLNTIYQRSEEMDTRRRIWKNFHLDRVQNPSSSVDQTKGNSSGRKSRAGAAHFHPVEDVLLKIFVVERFHGSIKWRLSLFLPLLEENPRGDTRLTVHVEVEAHGHIHFSSAFLPPDNRPPPSPSLSLSQGRAIVARLSA